MAKIYHYTSIDTLNLILKNRTIKFNRLDQVDDKEESEFGSGDSDVKIGKYIFVSCWTRDPEENLTLWKYVEGRAGERNAVRIALDEDMFKSHPINEDLACYFPHQVKIVEDCFFHYLSNIARKLHDKNKGNVPLKNDILNFIEVTMGPKTTAEDKNKVEKILFPRFCERLFSKRKVVYSCLHE